MRALVATAAAVAMLVLTATALGVGPWPGVVRTVWSPGGDVRYTVSRSGEATVLRAVRHGTVIATATLDGSWGIPAVTSTGLAGGLSPDGRTIVLSQPPTYSGLRSQSQFVLLSTRSLAVEKTVTLSGEFGFDAFSPNGETMFVIQHVSRADLVAYRVRAYDLARDRLVRGVIVAKGETETMRGYPVARATSRTGTWVYTLYHRQTGAPFIHALNTAQRLAVCIDLTWQPPGDRVWSTRLKLSADDRRLFVRDSGTTVSTVDTRTFRVS